MIQNKFGRSGGFRISLSSEESILCWYRYFTVMLRWNLYVKGLVFGNWNGIEIAKLDARFRIVLHFFKYLFYTSFNVKDPIWKCQAWQAVDTPWYLKQTEIKHQVKKSVEWDRAVEGS